MSTYFPVDLNTTVVTVDTSVISSTKVVVIPPNDPSPDLDTKGRLLYFKEITGIQGTSEFQVNWLSSSTSLVQQMQVQSLQCLSVFEFPANSYNPLNLYNGGLTGFASETSPTSVAVNAPTNRTVLFMDLQSQSKTLVLPSISNLAMSSKSPYYVIKDAYGFASTNALYVSTTRDATIDGRGTSLRLNENFATLEILGDESLNRWHILNYFGVSTSNTGWIPTNIANCQIWLDGADVDTLSLTGSNVAQWTDKSGSNNNASQSLTNKPTYFQSQKYLDFDIQQYLDFPNDAFPLNNNSYGYFIVGSFREYTDGLGLIGGGDYGTDSSIFALRSINTDGGIHHYWWNNDLSTGANAYSPNIPLIIEATYTSGGARATLTNGTQKATDNPTTRSQTGANNTLGTTNYTEYFYGTVNEVIVYNAALTTSQRESVEGYLAWKWNLESNLPLAHPYKTAPPSPGVYRALWKPTDISNCDLWFDADDITTVTGFSQVGEWRSKGSISVSAFPGTGICSSGNMLDNGLNYISCPAGNDLEFTCALNTQPRTWFIVARNTTQLDVDPVNYWGLVNQTVGAGQDAVVFVRVAETDYRGYIGPAGIGINTEMQFSTDPLNTLNMYTWVNSTNALSNAVTLNGNQVTLSISAAAANYNTNSIPYRINTAAYNTGSDMCEILFYSRALAPSERQQVEGYLAWKWGLQNSLPANHPYKFAAPAPPYITGIIAATPTYDTLTLTNAGGNGAFVFSYSPSGRVQWVARIDGTGGEQGWGVATDSDGNLFVAGFYGTNPVTIYNADGTAFGTTLANAGGQDGFLVKYNSSGVVQWVARYGGTGTDSVRNIMCDAAGNVYIGAGYTSNPIVFRDAAGTSIISMAGNGSATYIVKYDTNGTPQWATRIYGVTNTRGLGVDSSGNVVIGGYYNGTLTIYNQDGTTFGTLASFGAWDTYVVRFNTNGAALWSTRLAGSGTEEVSWFMTSDKNGNTFVTGYFSSASSTIYNSDGSTFGTFGSTNGSYDIMLVKYDISGFAEWNAIIGGSNLEEGRALTIDASGNSYVSGYYTSSPLNVYSANGTLFGTLGNSGGYDSCIVKYNSSGTVQWAARIGGTSSDYLFGMITDADGNLYITGDYNSTQLDIYNANGTLAGSLTSAGTSYEAYLIKYNSSGAVQWFTKMDGSGTDVGYAVAASSDSVYVTGFYTAAPLTVRSVGY